MLTKFYTGELITNMSRQDEKLAVFKYNSIQNNRKVKYSKAAFKRNNLQSELLFPKILNPFPTFLDLPFLLESHIRAFEENCFWARTPSGNPSVSKAKSLSVHRDKSQEL